MTKQSTETIIEQDHGTIDEDLWHKVTVIGDRGAYSMNDDRAMI